MRVSPINVRHQTIDPGSSENTKQDKMLNRIKAKQRNKPKAMSRNVIVKLQKIKEKKILEDSQQRIERNTLPMEEQG